MILKTVGVRGATFRVGLNEFLVYSRYRAKDELLEMAHEIQGNILKEDFFRLHFFLGKHFNQHFLKNYFNVQSSLLTALTPQRAGNPGSFIGHDHIPCWLE